MKKNDLVSQIAEKTGFTKKESAAALNACLAAISESLVAGDKVLISGFGIFESKQRDAYNGINPRTRERVVVPASKIVVFKPSKTLKDKF